MRKKGNPKVVIMNSGGDSYMKYDSYMERNLPVKRRHPNDVPQLTDEQGTALLLMLGPPVTDYRRPEYTMKRYEYMQRVEQALPELGIVPAEEIVDSAWHCMTARYMTWLKMRVFETGEHNVRESSDEL